MVSRPNYKIAICYFSVEYAALRRKTNVCWLVIRIFRHVYRGLLCQRYNVLKSNSACWCSTNHQYLIETCISTYMLMVGFFVKSFTIVNCTQSIRNFFSNDAILCKQNKYGTDVSQNKKYIIFYCIFDNHVFFASIITADKPNVSLSCKILLLLIVVL